MAVHVLTKDVNVLQVLQETIAKLEVDENKPCSIVLT